jgi:hypothetical protein
MEKSAEAILEGLVVMELESGLSGKAIDGPGPRIMVDPVIGKLGCLIGEKLLQRAKALGLDELREASQVL